MIVPFGEWSTEQSVAAIEAMTAHGARHADHPLARRRSPFIVAERLAKGQLRGAFIEGFLLVYDVGPTWCCEEDILHEYLVLRALPQGTFKDYLAGLRYIAKANGCIGISTGNGVLRPGLRRLYEREGFVKQNEAFYLGV